MARPRKDQIVLTIKLATATSRGDQTVYLLSNNGHEFIVPQPGNVEELKKGCTVQVTIKTEVAAKLGKEPVHAEAIKGPVRITSGKVSTKEGK